MPFTTLLRRYSFKKKKRDLPVILAVRRDILLPTALPASAGTMALGTMAIMQEVAASEATADALLPEEAAGLAAETPTISSRAQAQE